MSTGQKRNRKRDKINRIMRERGTPSYVWPHELDEVVAHVRWLNKSMSAQQIADRAGINRSAVDSLISGFRYRETGKREPVKGTRRSTYRALMSVGLEARDDKGARLDPVLCSRRLQALAVQGFSLDAIASVMNVSRSRVGRLQLGNYEWVYADSVDAVKLAFEKLDGADPVEHGTDPQRISRIVNGAVAKGYAPSTCWDDDTIDDPAAFPEWTGVCGTPEGRTVHRRIGVPVCMPCRKTGPTDGLAPFDGVALKRIIKEKGLTAGQVAGMLGRNPDTIYRWQANERSPNASQRVDIALMLGVRVTDLEIHHDV